MKKIMAMCTLAAAITACGGAPMDNSGDTGNTDKPTVQLFTEFVYDGVAADIIEAYKADRLSLDMIRRGDYEHDDDGQVSRYVITSFRRDIDNDESVIPREGAMPLDMVYTYDPMNPDTLVNLHRTQKDFWSDFGSGLLDYEQDTQISPDTNDHLITRYVDGVADSQERFISKIINVDGRTDKIEIYTDIDPSDDAPVLDNPDFVESYSYNALGLVTRRERLPSVTTADYINYDAYTYDDSGALATQTHRVSDDYFSEVDTTFEYQVDDDPEHGRVYVRIAASYRDATDEVIVYLYREAACPPSYKSTGTQNPQWYGCLYASDWGE